MAPLPPAMLGLADAVRFTAGALEISQGLALDRLIDGLCDGALFADGVFRSAKGLPNRLKVSPSNWQMHKYNGASLHYDFVEIATSDLIVWLRLDEKVAALSDAPSAARTGAPGRPSSMTFVVEEAKRRIIAGEVDAPDKASFANELKDWLSAQPGLPRATGKTIRQNPQITALFNGFKKARNTSPK